jgi:hypothetical protein
MKEIFTPDTGNIQTHKMRQWQRKLPQPYRVCNKQVEPLTGKWYIHKAVDALDHHPVHGTIDSNTEVEITERCQSTSGGLDTLKVQNTKQKCDCDFTSVTVDRNSPKRPRRQPVTRSSDFLWTDTHK